MELIINEHYSLVIKCSVLEDSGKEYAQATSPMQQFMTGLLQGG